MNKPSWADAPEWAQALAQDENGGWHWYEERPEIAMVCGDWWSTSGKRECARCIPDWRTTLEERPHE